VSTVAIVLATDPGDGFTTSKYATLIDGESMLRAAVESALSWDVDDRVIVLGPDAEQNADLIDDLAVTVVIDPEWHEGASSPLRVALDLVTRDLGLERTVISRADQHRVTSEIVNKLVGVAADTSADAVVPKYRYQRGWPVVVGSSLWQRLLGLEGDYDLQSLISMHAAVIEEVWFDRLAPPIIASGDDIPVHGR
jgi:CTP:molybdopterin cytidylyltransferase MocA